METLHGIYALLLAGASGYIGWGLLHDGLASIRWHRQLHQRGLTTTGCVIRIREERVAGGHIWAYPTFQYEVMGTTHNYETERTDYREDFKVGQQVKLRYLPEEPGHCTWRSTSTMSYLLSLAGIVSLLISLVFLLYVILVAVRG